MSSISIHSQNAGQVVPSITFTILSLARDSMTLPRISVLASGKVNYQLGSARRRSSCGPDPPKAFFRFPWTERRSLLCARTSINSVSSSERISSSSTAYSIRQHGSQREAWRHGRSGERRNFFMRTCMAGSGFLISLHANADFPSSHFARSFQNIYRHLHSPMYDSESHCSRQTTDDPNRHLPYRDRGSIGI